MRIFVTVIFIVYTMLFVCAYSAAAADVTFEKSWKLQEKKDRQGQKCKVSLDKLSVVDDLSDGPSPLPALQTLFSRFFMSYSVSAIPKEKKVYTTVEMYSPMEITKTLFLQLWEKEKTKDQATQIIFSMKPYVKQFIISNNTYYVRYGKSDAWSVLPIVGGDDLEKKINTSFSGNDILRELDKKSFTFEQSEKKGKLIFKIYKGKLLKEGTENLALSFADFADFKPKDTVRIFVDSKTKEWKKIQTEFPVEKMVWGYTIKFPFKQVCEMIPSSQVWVKEPKENITREEKKINKNESELATEILLLGPDVTRGFDDLIYLYRSQK